MKAILERIVHHPKTTLAGVGLSTIGVYVLKSWNCELPHGAAGWMAWGMVAGPTILGILSKD